MECWNVITFNVTMINLLISCVLLIVLCFLKLIASTCYGRLDDLLVGAPMHSVSTDPELGRVYVYRNTQVSFPRVLWFG